MDETTRYSSNFYAEYNATSEASAEAVVPEVIRLIKPSSLVDVGCGEGVWLSVFGRHGVRRTLGIDGDYVKRERLRIPVETFQPRDLTQPFSLPERFDLVMSLEVAEHLPEGSAPGFVRSLTGLGPVVLFSAAVPYQGGTYHINLQWQDYWARLFGAHGYVAIDAIRPVVWGNPEVSFWYRQNTLLFVDEGHLRTQPELQRIREEMRRCPLTIAHPQFVTLIGRGVSDEQLDTLHLGQVLPRLPKMIVKAIRHRLGGA